MQKVQDLQRFVEGLIGPLANLGVTTKVQADLSRLAACLEPFTHHTLTDFADFLVKADAHIRTGEWPVPGKTSKKIGKGKASVEEMAQRVMSLYERAAADSVFDYAEVDALIESLAPLTVAQLSELAKQVDVDLPKKPKKQQALEEISRSIKNRRANWERTGLKGQAVTTG
jgi:hypothetical protein